MATSRPAPVSVPRAPLAARREAAHSLPREPVCDLAQFVEAQLLHAERELTRPASELHGGIHEARKSLRKARAVLRLARRGLDAAAGDLDRQLGDECKRLSTLRDAQAMTETLTRLEQGGDSDPAVRTALPFALDRRDALLDAALNADPGFAGVRVRLQALRLDVARLNWSDVSGFDLTRGIARSETRVLAAYVHALALPTDHEAWHQLRRRLRRLKHQSVLLSGCSPILQGSQFNEDMLQSLAHAQDEHVLLGVCGRQSPFPMDVRRTLRTLLRRRLRVARKAVHKLRRSLQSDNAMSRHSTASPRDAQGSDHESLHRTP